MVAPALNNPPWSNSKVPRLHTIQSPQLFTNPLMAISLARINSLPMPHHPHNHNRPITSNRTSSTPSISKSNATILTSQTLMLPQLRQTAATVATVAIAISDTLTLTPLTTQFTNSSTNFTSSCTSTMGRSTRTTTSVRMEPETTILTCNRSNSTTMLPPVALAASVPRT